MINIKCFEFNYFAENTYLLYDETKEAVLIDCGCLFTNEQQALSGFITENDLTLKHLLCTHMHLDHVFGNEYIYKTYGLQPEAHLAETEQLPGLQEQAKAFGLDFPIKPVPLKKTLIGNEVVRFGNSELRALLVPGHSPGSLAFYCEAEGFVIAGDALFSGSIGRTDLWGGNQEELVAAIKDKLLTLPDETVVYPGHGAITTILDEKLNNPYLL